MEDQRKLCILFCDDLVRPRHQGFVERIVEPLQAEFKEYFQLEHDHSHGLMENPVERNIPRCGKLVFRDVIELVREKEYQIIVIDMMLGKYGGDACNVIDRILDISKQREKPLPLFVYITAHLQTAFHTIIHGASTGIVNPKFAIPMIHNSDKEWRKLYNAIRNRIHMIIGDAQPWVRKYDIEIIDIGSFNQRTLEELLEDDCSVKVMLLDFKGKIVGTPARFRTDGAPFRVLIGLLFNEEPQTDEVLSEKWKIDSGSVRQAIARFRRKFPEDLIPMRKGKGYVINTVRDINIRPQTSKD